MRFFHLNSHYWLLALELLTLIRMISSMPRIKPSIIHILTNAIPEPTQYKRKNGRDKVKMMMMCGHFIQPGISILSQSYSYPLLPFPPEMTDRPEEDEETEWYENRRLVYVIVICLWSFRLVLGCFILVYNRTIFISNKISEESRLCTHCQPYPKSTKSSCPSKVAWSKSSPCKRGT